MEPAVKDGQLIFLNRIAPYLSSYKIDDIVLFEYERKEGTCTFLLFFRVCYAVFYLCVYQRVV